jgi:fringe protein
VHRTTVSNHRKRLPLLFETWLTKVNTSQVVLVTDGDDPFTRLWTSVKGMHYVDVKCGNSYSREQLCCKAGSELALMFREENKAYDWICHTDDDMYVNVRNLISLLSGFDPRKDPIYFGRSGSPWHEPRRVKRKAQLSKPGKKYHFAVGGMYCLSRAMLEKTRQWLVGGEAFSKTCSLTREPEDVTVGLIVAMQNFSLSRTERINTHGLHLASNVDPYTLADQVAISYGYGSVRWGEDPYNAVYVPDALFTLQEDESQFRSLHCLLYPSTSWCLQQREMVQEMRLSTTDYDMDYSDNTNE